jgi:uncharacterized protein YoxC
MSDDTNSIPQIAPISVDFFSKKDFKFRTLVNNSSESNYLKARNSWYKLPLVDAAYIEKIVIFVDGYGDFDDFDVECVLGSDTVFTSKARIKESTIEVLVDKFISCLMFRPQKKLWGSQIIKRIELFGYRPDETKYFESKISDFDSEIGLSEQRLAKLSNEEGLINSRILEKRASIDILEKQISGLSDEQERQTVRLSALQGEVSTEAERRNKLLEAIKDIDAKISDLNNKKRDLDVVIEGRKKEYKKLIDEIRLFPSEIAGVVAEGDRAISIYKSIIWLSAAIIALLVGHLLYGAWNFVGNATLPASDVVSTLVSRAPLIIIYIFIIKVFAVLIGKLIDEIMRISTQRINISAISMFAKDISTASANDLDLSDDDRYEKETILKMEMLRDHLKNYLSESFRYSGKGVAARFLDIFRKKTDSDAGSS